MPPRRGLQYPHGPGAAAADIYRGVTMATIMPFRGTRFNPAVAGALDSLITLPYDRINQALQDEYYAKSEHNICRVIKGREFPGDTPEDNVYTRAGATWRQWITEGAVREDAQPALYVYHQTFTAEGREHTRRGLCAMIELQDYSSGAVKPHERTLDAPKQDRFKLFMTTDTHFGQIFQLYPDDANEVQALLAAQCERPADVDAVIDEEGQVRHRMWAITDPAVIKAVQAKMDSRLLFIADGHHRYETALNYRNHRLAEYTGGPDGHNPRYAMMTLVGMSDPGLVVLPTHRVLFGLPDFDVARLVAGLERYFTVKPGLTREQLFGVMDAARADAGRNAFGLYCGGKYWFFELSDKHIMEKLAPERSAAWRSLDVAVLHEVVLEHLLGIDKPAQAAKTNLSYDRLAEMSIGRVDKGTHQAVLFMNPTKLNQIREVAGKGEVMPQKSTDFYPKLIDGMVACQVDLGQKK
jgi:uncharacterized protein (DUF1015 family)